METKAGIQISRRAFTQALLVLLATNMLYPTSAVLLISLGLTTVSYPKWPRWSLPIWLVVIAISVFALWLSVSISLAPF